MGRESEMPRTRSKLSSGRCACIIFRVRRWSRGSGRESRDRGGRSSINMIDACRDQWCRNSGSVMEFNPTLDRDCRASDGDPLVLWLEKEGRIYEVRGPYRGCRSAHVVTQHGCTRFACLMDESVLGREVFRLY